MKLTVYTLSNNRLYYIVPEISHVSKTDDESFGFWISSWWSRHSQTPSRIPQLFTRCELIKIIHQIDVELVMIY